MADKVFVSVDGCDDSTMFTLSVSDAERAFLAKLERISNKLGGGCKATLTVTAELPEYTTTIDGDGDEIEAELGLEIEE